MTPTPHVSIMLIQGQVCVRGVFMPLGDFIFWLLSHHFYFQEENYT
jgi:hypothetical protein